MILELLAGYVGGSILFGGGSTTVVYQRPLTEAEAKEKIRKDQEWERARQLAHQKELAWRKAHPILAKRKDEEEKRAMESINICNFV